MKRTPLFLSIIIIVASAILIIQQPTHAQNPDTTLDYATYLGTSTSDNHAIAVAINPNKEVIVAFNIGSNGEIQRYKSDGKTLLSRTTTDGAIHDMDVNRSNGDIAIVGDFGLKVFDATATTEDTARSKQLTEGIKRVSISSDGRIVTSASDSVTLWANDGSQISQATTEDMSGKTDRHVLDVAISAEHGNIYVGGYRQAHPQYQSPFLYAFQDDLTNRVWRSYDYWKSLVDEAQPYALNADSRLYRITIGRDGGLYILGEAHGGTTVFKTDALIPESGNAADLGYIQAVEIDNWNKMHDTNSAAKAFFGKVDPNTGQVIQGQFILPRWDKDGTAGAGSSRRNYNINDGSLAVDENGTVYVGGSAGKYIKGRFEGTLTINGVPVGEIIPDDVDIPNNEMTIYIVDSTFTTRETWTVLTKQRSNGSVTGFAATDGMVALVGTSSYGELFTTTGATAESSLNGTDQTLNDAYFALLKAGETEPEKIPPIVADIPDQTVLVGETFTPINLDEYVKDPDGELENLTWSYTPTQELAIRFAYTNSQWIATIDLPEDSTWSGTETITFIATDVDGLSDSDDVTFTRTENNPPVARNDSAVWNQETPLSIDVLANDSDSDNSIVPTSIHIATDNTSTPGDPYAPGDSVVPVNPEDPDTPINGVVSIVNNTIVFSPTSIITGTSSFTYTVQDTLGAVSNEAFVTIVFPPVEGFVETSQVYTTTQDQAITFAMTDGISDTASNTIFALTTEPTNGTAQIDGDGVRMQYTPVTGFVGEDTLDYLVKDEQGIKAYVQVRLVVEESQQDEQFGMVYLPIVLR